jgi:hypothetical protein
VFLHVDQQQRGLHGGSGGALQEASGGGGRRRPCRSCAANRSLLMVKRKAFRVQAAGFTSGLCRETESFEGLKAVYQAMAAPKALEANCVGV